jgi:hypothetical protein
VVVGSINEDHEYGDGFIKDLGELNTDEAGDVRYLRNVYDGKDYAVIGSKDDFEAYDVTAAKHGDYVREDIKNDEEDEE